MGGRAVNGHPWGATELVTDVKLEDQFLLGSLVNIDSGDFASGFDPVHIDPTAPSSIEGRLWYDTTNNVLRVRRTDTTPDLWVPVGEGRPLNTAVNFAVGEVGIFQSSGLVTKLSTGAGSLSRHLFAGVALEAITSGNEGIFIQSGIVPIVTDAVSISELLIASSTSGRFDSSPLADDDARFAYGYALATQVTPGNLTSCYLYGNIITAQGQGILNALDGAASPSVTNPFATIEDTESQASFLIGSAAIPGSSFVTLTGKKRVAAPTNTSDFLYVSLHSDNAGGASTYDVKLRITGTGGFVDGPQQSLAPNAITSIKVDTSLDSPFTIPGESQTYFDVEVMVRKDVGGGSNNTIGDDGTAPTLGGVPPLEFVKSWRAS